MSIKHDQCDRQRIDDIVDSRMTPSQQATFEEHLSHCKECRNALWQQTADPDSWEKAGACRRSSSHRQPDCRGARRGSSTGSGSS